MDTNKLWKSIESKNKKEQSPNAYETTISENKLV